jgi:hypothetical protein
MAAKNTKRNRGMKFCPKCGSTKSFGLQGFLSYGLFGNAKTAVIVAPSLWKTANSQKDSEKNGRKTRKELVNLLLNEHPKRVSWQGRI